VPVLRLALDFLESEQKRPGVCSHAVEYLWKLLRDIDKALHETSLQTSFPSNGESANRYPPKERGLRYTNWESSVGLPAPCLICGADTCFAAVKLEGSYVGCLKCLGEGFLEHKGKVEILVYLELERLRKALPLVHPLPCKSCCREGLGASDEELAEFRKEEAQGNLVYRDCLEEGGFTGVLKISADGKLTVGTREVTKELAERVYVAGAGTAAERAEAQGLLPFRGLVPPLVFKLFHGREPELEQLLAEKLRGLRDTKQAAVDLLSLHHTSPLTSGLPAPPAIPSIRTRPPVSFSPTDSSSSAWLPPGAPVLFPAVEPTSSPSGPVQHADFLPSPCPVLPTQQAPSFPGLCPSFLSHQAWHYLIHGF
jgi:hypothetical protein